MRVDDDDEWIAMHERLARQLTKFQSKGGELPHMSSRAAWINLHSKCALEWWSTWGQEVPDLQRLTIKIVPLMIGSGPAERTWKAVDVILTKKHNRLSVKKCMDILYVRTWLRRSIKIVSDEELECFKGWETELFQQGSISSMNSCCKSHSLWYPKEYITFFDNDHGVTEELL